MGYAPNCKKCKDIYGFVKLLSGNQFIVDLYQEMNTQFVIDHHIEQIIFDNHKDTILKNGGILEVVRLLSLIKQTIKDITEVPKGVDSS